MSNSEGRLPAAPNLNGAATRHAHPYLAPAAGSIVDAFRPSELAPSDHPAMNRGDAAATSQTSPA